MSKFWLVVGFAAGYVAGSAAGRKQYERIRHTVQDLWERPEVQRTVKRVDDFVEEKAPTVHDLGEAAVDSVKSTGPEPTGATS
jgi:hypothetical protein